MITRWQKQQDYYIIRMYQDLFGDWIVAQSWGNSQAQTSDCSETVAPSYQEARLQVRGLRKELKAKGFRHVARKETQLGFEFGCNLTRPLSVNQSFALDQ